MRSDRNMKNVWIKRSYLKFFAWMPGNLIGYSKLSNSTFYGEWMIIIITNREKIEAMTVEELVKHNVRSFRI